MDATLAAWSPRIRSILRMITALLLIQHGTSRVFDFPHWERTGGGSLPPTLLIVASCFELIGGGLAFLGLFSRPVCFLLSDMARAITAEILHVDGGFHAMGTPLEGMDGTAERPLEEATAS